MLEPPPLPYESVVSCLLSDFGVQASGLNFLPLGADPHTAVYRATAADGSEYFVKLRSGNFFAASVIIPKALQDSGIRQVIAPIPAKNGALWADLPPYRLILFPFIEGQNGFEQPLTNSQWIEFGGILKQLHTAVLPEPFKQAVPQENFDTGWRRQVEVFLTRIENEKYTEPIAAETAAFLWSKRTDLIRLVRHTDRLAQKMASCLDNFILCHADIHAGNLHITKDGSIYIIDWDTLIFAPCERDLMFIGAGLGGGSRTAAEEWDFFFQGYGPTMVNQDALTYYRCDRILEDIAVYCEQLLLTEDGGADRPQGLKYLKSNFWPGGTIELAFQPASIRSTP